MSIKDIPEKIKSQWVNTTKPVISGIKENFDIKQDTFIILVIIFIGLTGFGLGKLSALEKGREPIQITPTNSVNIPIVQNTNIPMSAAAMISSETAKGMLVASKSGTKYHFPWCAGASQISENNKIWFNSYEEALKAGYTPASNCKGLK